jgi:hypothetical protein
MKLEVGKEPFGEFSTTSGFGKLIDFNFMLSEISILIVLIES